MISKRFYLSLCEHVDIPFTLEEQKIIGESTDRTGRFMDAGKYLAEMKKRGRHITENQIFIIGMLMKVEKIRRFNKYGKRV